SPIININRVVGTEVLGHAGFTGAALHPATGFNMGNPIESQMLADLRGAISPRTYRYHHPNKIELLPGFQISGNGIVVVANTFHTDHNRKISNNMRRYFLELAMYFVQMSLYKMRSRFANLQTTFGSIELFIDDLQEAKNERRELLEQMEAKSLFNSDRKK